ncbi:phage integrase N-terminal SAM-like domain-containing protein [Halomicroarcula sp. F13]|uniref:Phage integrase N-terminal SAM-like domain-containing protein n=1 Tax=Haloarcula rubra TaxID=2487747 RepID=A0AAW4PX15_9EURY|nr:phage integrase N-terminal SAM-like domain-containing protein [Halomicroarcula rubra]MBX0325194.1 phage integrase N-terminal SAM-like domain-containing protein [Halomicroarcula rubra]
MDLDDRLSEYEAILKYFDEKESSLSDDVLELNQRVLRFFFIEAFPDLSPKETTTEHVRDFLSQLDERDLKHSSKRRYLEVLSAFFSYSLRDEDIGAISFNPPGIVLKTYPRKPESEQ